MSDASLLTRLTDFYGNSAFIEDDPACVRHRDVLCVPAGTAGSSPGLFDRGRKMLGAAADHRATPHPQHPHDPYTTLDPERFDFAPDDFDYVFLGTLTGHYGHFITTAMARLWVARLASGARTRYVVLNRRPVEGFFDTEFLAEILGAVGVGPDNLASFDHPVRFRRITVPNPAIEEHNFSHRVFGTLCARIGDLMVPEHPAQDDTPVFLSKAILAAGVSRIVNEPELCDRLVRAGVDIVHPETMNMPQKIAMFRSRRVLTGLAGSGLHTGVFAPNRDKLALAFSSYLLSNQLLLDQASGGTTATYMAESIVEPQTPGWQTTYRLADPVGAAEAFLGLMEHELRPRIERRRQAGGGMPAARQRSVGSFRFRRENGRALAGLQGWWEMEDTHCWTSGPTSLFDLALSPSQGELTLSLQVGAAVVPPHLVSRPLTVFANGAEVARFTVGRLTAYDCALPRGCLDGNVLRLRFEHPITASPRDLGLPGDTRDMSICFAEIAVTERLP